MAEFAIASVIFSVDPEGAGALVEYQCIDFTVNSTTEGLQVSPMDTAAMGAFPGEDAWSGTFTVLYDDTTGSPSPNVALWAGAVGTVSCAMTDQTHTTPVVVTFSGAIVITDTSVTFNKTSVPVLECTFLGNGALTETP